MQVNVQIYSSTNGYVHTQAYTNTNMRRRTDVILKRKEKWNIHLQGAEIDIKYNDWLGK